MNDTVETTEVEVTPAADIIRGRMPLAMVYAIRFLEEGTDSELAAKYRTTPGKVNDIKKNRNFAYIDESAKFTQEQIDQAKERAEQLGDHTESVTEKLDSMDVATEEEAAALVEKRTADRKPRGKAKEEAEGDDPVEEVEDELEDEDLEGLLD